MTNFTIIGFAINDIPFEIYLESLSLNNNPYKIKVTLNDTNQRGVLCTLKGGVSSFQILEDWATFKPITRFSSEVYSTSFKSDQVKN